jgi:NAD(P)-dependent dehydrogenase (short-subunit alcohol dehydrogenase family)
MPAAQGRLAGEVVVVTGSTSGLGREVARQCAAEGAAVVVTGRHEERGESVAASIRADGHDAAFVAADLADDASIRALIKRTVKSFGSLTVLVNNAAATDGPRDAPLADITDDAWNRILLVNLTAVARLCRAAIPQMVKAGHGSIVNISSRAAERGTPGLAAYAASKGGLNALTRSIAVDYAKAGIRCNTISPGYIIHEWRDADLTREQHQRLGAMHLTRLGTPQDVAYATVYLASSEAGFVTGINLSVDGGSTVARARVLG